MIRDAKKRGVKITCETCPHYFSLTVDEVLRKGTNAKMNPPLREEKDRLAIIEGLKRRNNRLHNNRPCTTFRGRESKKFS